MHYFLADGTTSHSSLLTAREPNGQLLGIILIVVEKGLRSFLADGVMSYSSLFTAAEPNGQLSGIILKVVENTPKVHHLLVCTLCSCYPISVLGMAPSWSDPYPTPYTVNSNIDFWVATQPLTPHPLVVCPMSSCCSPLSPALTKASLPSWTLLLPEEIFIELSILAPPSPDPRATLPTLPLQCLLACNF